MSAIEPVRVKDVMTNNYQLVDGLMMVNEALSIMKSSGSVVLIVDKRHAHDEYGIVLLSDIAREVLAVDRSPQRVNIYEIILQKSRRYYRGWIRHGPLPCSAVSKSWCRRGNL